MCGCGGDDDDEEFKNGETSQWIYRIGCVDGRRMMGEDAVVTICVGLFGIN